MANKLIEQIFDPHFCTERSCKVYEFFNIVLGGNMGFLDKAKESLDKAKDTAKETIKKADEEKKKKKTEEAEIKAQYEEDLKKTSGIVVTTGDINKDYDIVGICTGFSNSGKYLKNFEDEALATLRVSAMRKGCDAVTNIRFLLVDRSNDELPTSIKGAIGTGIKLATAYQKQNEKKDLLAKAIPPGGIVVYGTGIKFKN